MSHQFHFERKFYLDKKTGYWISTKCPKIRAHVWVWINTIGPIKKGMHIHHKDGNKSNNSIENLECLTVKAHLKKHDNEERKLKSRKWCEKIRPLTKDWHASQQGLQWHKEHAEKCNFGKWEPIEYICDQCSSSFKSSKRSRTKFCSNACKSKWRRMHKIDDIQKICPVCKTQYTASKYSRSKTCGKKCGFIFRSKVNSR